MLCEEELVASIREKLPDFPIHVSDLKAPTAKFVQSYYIRILEELGVDVDQLKEPSAENLRELDYPEAYRSVVPLANLHGALCYVFKNVYVDDFSVLDLIEPSPRRTQFLIKALDAFHTFADWKAQSVQDNVEKLQKRMTEYHQLRTQTEELKAKLNVCASEQAQREVARKELLALNEETKRKFLQLKEEDDKLQEKITSVEAVVEQRKQKESQLQTELEKLEEEACELKSKIVTVPADLEADLHRLRDKKQELKAERQRLLELKQEKNRQKELHENFLQKQEKCIARLKDITALCERLKICEMKKQKSDGAQALVRETQEIEERTKKLRMRVTELQEEKVALSTQWEKEKAALRQSIKEAESEQDQLKKLEDDLTKIKAEREEVDEKIKRLSQLNEEQNRLYDKQYEEKIAKQDAALKKIEDDRTQLLEKMKQKFKELNSV